jgi:DNA-binding response OmpR family regulator
MAEPHRSVGVLVVEDDALVALAIETALCDLGFTEISLAHDIETAAALVQTKAFGLGILDINIGRRLVFPLAVALREKLIPIVFSTGWTAQDMPPEWAGHPIVQKPFAKPALAAVLGGLGFGIDDGN